MTGVFALLLAAALIPSAAEKHVRPVALPAQPGPSQRVVLRFRTVQTLDGVYHAESEQAGCDGPRSAGRAAPHKGRVVRLKLSPPKRGWCAGEYRATVFFKQAVHCPPTIECGDSVEVPIGSTTFTAGDRESTSLRLR